MKCLELIRDFKDRVSELKQKVQGYSSRIAINYIIEELENVELSEDYCLDFMNYIINNVEEFLVSEIEELQLIRNLIKRYREIMSKL
ncbi:MAG: hypothetical protein B6V02_03480 [Thermoprotei archaeon ex4572_64]|nr:MAG: hypothetical protein B6V02_03480 [Thermoprotei archaeon ex4572_64]